MARSMPWTATKRSNQSRKNCSTDWITGAGIVRVSGATVPHPVRMTLSHTRTRECDVYGDPHETRAHTYTRADAIPQRLDHVRRHLPRDRRRAQPDLGRDRPGPEGILPRGRTDLLQPA